VPGGTEQFREEVGATKMGWTSWLQKNGPRAGVEVAVKGKRYEEGLGESWKISGYVNFGLNS